MSNGTKPDRCVCDHFEHKPTGECVTCGMFCGPVSNEVGREIMAEWQSPPVVEAPPERIWGWITGNSYRERGYYEGGKGAQGENWYMTEHGDSWSQLDVAFTPDPKADPEYPRVRVKKVPLTSTWSCPNCNRQNVYREGVVSDLQNKCVACGTEVIVGAIRSTDAPDVQAADVLDRARAIVNAAMSDTGVEIISEKFAIALYNRIAARLAASPVQGPCSACGDGDTAMRFHDHKPVQADEVSRGKDFGLEATDEAAAAIDEDDGIYPAQDIYAETQNFWGKDSADKPTDPKIG